jgi:hypothetical protein
VGNLKAKVAFTDGRVSEFPFVMGVPGASSNNGYSYVYCLDDKPSALNADVSTAALMRPIATSSVKTASDLTVNFTVKGSNVHNGWIWFYNASGSYIGRSVYFLDASTGTPFGGMNSGGGFSSTDGSVNSVAIAQTDIIDSYGEAITAAAFGDITQAWVVVVDGAQYAGPGSFADYDYRAISGGINF